MNETEPKTTTGKQPQQEEKIKDGDFSDKRSTGSTNELTPSPVDPDISASLAVELEEADGGALKAGSRHPRARSVFNQVRNQIKCQVGTNFHGKGIVDVVQRVARGELDKSTGGVLRQSETNGDSANDNLETTAGREAMEEGGYAKEEMLASLDALRREFKEDMALLRTEMQTYTDKAIKGLESKAFSRRSDTRINLLRRMNSSEQPSLPRANRSLEERQKSLSVPSLVPRKNRILNRTLTTLNPKPSHPASMGPRSKSETLGSSGDNRESPEFQVGSNPNTKRSSVAGGELPACPPLHHSKNLLKGRVMQ